MTAHNIVIVESPAKAKTINKYLGPDYKVVASFGHVRDLPPKDGSVRPDEDFAMSWELGDRAAKPVGEIAKLVKGADAVYLATDPDREGEAISWHVAEILKDKKLLDKVDVKRVTFNEITKKAVLDAFANARDLDYNLIDAYMARRALDYLVGFTLSPVLWRKLPGSRSAGRVQSVALRLICEREGEIEVFKADEYWSIEAQLENPQGKPFTARLTHLDGRKLDKLSIADEKTAKAAVEKIRGQKLSVSEVEQKRVSRNPYPPFITSTLQQEASRKLGLGATRTMRTAQQLYEGVEIGGETVGLITYMRTDGVTLGQDAIASCRSVIAKKFGDNYVPDAPRMYKSKVKNAQEAHEAIRPTDLSRTPEDVKKYLDGEQFALYQLIWKRTIACQMASAAIDQVGVDIVGDQKNVTLRATGSVIVFDGFLKVYEEDRDDSDGDDENSRILPPLQQGDTLKTLDVTPNQHFTQPPPRYTEASLVKKMEELGIGRPSTYASIMQVLQDRGYVRLDKKRFIPESRGRLVTAFLVEFFKRYVEYNFTADLEERLDEISAGDINWKSVLRDFWTAFSGSIAETKNLTITEVIDALDKELERFFFPRDPAHPEKDPRVCPTCGDGRLGLKLGKFGAFAGCSNYPECKYTRPLTSAEGEDPANAGAASVIELGNDPKTGLPVTLRRGPYGPYAQLGPAPDAVEDKKAKPKRTGLPRGMIISEVTLDTALALLSLPRVVGKHPETGEDIEAGIGRFGPFLKHQGKFKSIPAGEPEGVLTIGLNRAVDLLAQAKQNAATVLKELGPHPEDQKPVTVNSGRYGAYVKHGKTNATLPKGAAPETLTMEQAVELLAARAAKGPAAKKKKAAAKPKKETATKKPAKKKKAQGD